MTKAVIFDMYETLITLFESPLYFGTQMEGTMQPSKRKPEFIQLETPLDILNII